jgi:hypothetical protein
MNTNFSFESRKRPVWWMSVLTRFIPVQDISWIAEPRDFIFNAFWQHLLSVHCRGHLPLSCIFQGLCNYICLAGRWHIRSSSPPPFSWMLQLEGHVSKCIVEVVMWNVLGYIPSVLMDLHFHNSKEYLDQLNNYKLPRGGTVPCNLMWRRGRMPPP